MMHSQVKLIGPNGQISLGKAFAGQMVLMDQIDEGIWIIKTGQFIPDSEKWLHQPEHAKKLVHALEWTQKNKPKNNFDELTNGFIDEKNNNRHE